MKARWKVLRSTKDGEERGRRSRFGRLAGLLATVGSGFALELCESTFGQVPQTLKGPPLQVQPYVPEPGVPLITINPGTVNPFSGVDTSGAGNATGTDGSGAGDATGGDYSSGGGGIGNSTALGTMLGKSWGNAAVANAQTLGVNPSALAATCVLESGCQNVGGSGTISGVFQMSNSTYAEAIQAALEQNPGIASQIVPGLAGKMDPPTQSIAAAEYLYQGAQALQGAGIENPTVLDVRGYYNFGPANGVNIAKADDSETMASVLTGLSASTLAANGIKPGETVGQWRASVSAKIGNATGQSVLM